MKRIFLFSVMSLLLFSAQTVFAKSKAYITNPTAKLGDKASFAATGELIPVGSQVDVVGTEGAFLKISYKGKTGYVSKMFTSENPPVGKIDASGKPTEDSPQASARKRSSTFAETASARGLTESEKMRSGRGGSDDDKFSYSGVEWIQKISDSVKDADRTSFESSEN
jgi:hypothetical protein